METLIVEQHKNDFCSRSKPQGYARFESSPSNGFRGINCRTFESGYGLLPSPLKSKSFNENPDRKTSPKSNPIPIKGKGCRKDLTFDEDFSGGSCLPTPLKSQSFNENPYRKTSPKSNPIPINGKACRKELTFDDDLSGGSFLLSELWAGPTYSNSPPPSSLPIPKFSVRPKRTVSLDLPGSSPEIELRIMAKSAPSSPTRERLDFTRDLFVNADSATQTLRRILNLNLNDE